MSCLAECGHRWTQRKKKAIWTHGSMESLHCCQSGGREVAKVTWEGVNCRGGKGQMWQPSSMWLGSMWFQVLCSMWLENPSFQWLCWCCGRVNALLMLPESCHTRAENAANATSVQGARGLGYIFIVLEGAQLPVPLSQLSRTTGITPGHWTKLLSHWCPAVVAGQLVWKACVFLERGVSEEFSIKEVRK